MVTFEPDGVGMRLCPSAPSGHCVPLSALAFSFITA